ncbi:MAG: hypothetical protein AB7O28_11140 [Vicinamibacterales bacterium]
MSGLTKWYLDLVTDEGTALVAYAATLDWSALHVDAASALIARPGAPPVDRWVWRSAAPPALTDGAVRYASPALALAAEWRAAGPALSETLFEDARGAVRWTCHAPDSEASFRLGPERFRGRGYVECLTFTRPPWSLPLRRLRWGRFCAASHHAVWIDWDEGVTRRWIWFDGRFAPEARVQASGVVHLPGGHTLDIVPGRTLLDRRALQVLTDAHPALAALPMGPLRRLRETKRLDRGILRRDGAAVASGWVIHETVVW